MEEFQDPGARLIEQRLGATEAQAESQSGEEREGQETRSGTCKQRKPIVWQDDGKTYIPEAILGVKWDPDAKAFRYQVKWKDFDDSENPFQEGFREPLWEKFQDTRGRWRSKPRRPMVRRALSANVSRPTPRGD